MAEMTVQPAPRPLQVFPVAIGRYADGNFEPLDTEPEIRKVAELLADFGGYHVPWTTALEQRGADAVTERLQVWSTPDDEHDTFLYWVGHGWSNRMHASLAHHLSPYEVGVNGLIPRQLAAMISARESHPAGRDTWAIVVVDACTAARFVRAVAAEINDDPFGAHRVLLVGVAGEGATRLGVFSAALARCLRNTFRSNAEITLWDLAGELGRLLPDGSVEGDAASLAGAVLTRRVPIAAELAATLDVLDEIEAVLTRPAPVGAAVTLDVRSEISEVLATLSPDERRHFLPKAQGGETGELMSYFTGREGELTAIASWLRTERTGMLVLTGNAGTGKSAILGHLLMQSRPQLREVFVGRGLVERRPPDLRPADDVFDLQLLLTGATVADVVGRVAAAADLGTPPAARTGPRVAWLLGRLQERRRPLTLLLDALDEAQHPRTLADQLIRRLSTVDGVRIVVGTRQSTREEPDMPHPAGHDLLDALTAKAGPVRVVTVEQDPSAVTRYVTQRLAAAVAQRRLAATAAQIEEIAGSIGTGGREFLFAKLAVHEILARPTLLAPDRSAELADLLSGNHRRLFAAAVTRLRDQSAIHGTLLEALALARGRGLPIRNGIWGAVAAALAAEPVGDQAIDALLRAAAPYLMLDSEDGQTVYRLAHRTFQESFPARRPLPQRQREVARALLAAVPRPHRGPLNPYLAVHLSGHVAAAGMDAWHDLATRPDVLDRLDPRAVTGDALRSAFGLPDLPAEIAGVIAARHLLVNASPEDQRGLREIAMARHAGISRFPPAAVAELTGAAWALRWASIRRTPLHLTLTGHTDWVLAVAAFTANDGRAMLASGGRDGSIRVWDLVSGAPIGDRLGAPDMGWVWSLAGVTTAAGRTLLASSARDGRVRLWNPATGVPAVPTLVGHTGPGYAVAEVVADPAGHGSDRRLLASGGDDGTIRLSDLTTGTLTHVLTGHTGPVWAIAGLQRDLPHRSGPAAPPGDLLASGGDDGTVRLWDPATGEQVGEPMTGHTGPVWTVVGVSMPDGPDLLASAGADGTVRLWNPATGACVAVLTGHIGRVPAVASFTTTDERTLLASGGEDGTVRLWDPTTGGCAGTLAGHAGGVQAVAAATTPDRRTLLVSGGRDGTVRVWDPVRALATPAPAGHAGPVWAVTALIAGNGQATAASGGEDRTIRLWNPTSGLSSGVLAGHTDRVSVLAGLTTAAGQVLLASGSEDGTVRLWDPRAGASSAVLTGHDGWVLALAAVTLPGGRTLLASGGDDGTIRLWDPVTGGLIHVLAGHDGWVHALTALTLPGGRVLLASAGADETVRLWDPATGQPAGEPLTGHGGPVWTLTGLDRAAERPLLASGGRDGTVRLWDPGTGEQLGYPLTGHTGLVRGLAVLNPADGRSRLASGSEDGTVRVWDLTTRTATHLLAVQSEVNALVAVGDTLIAGGADGVLAFAINTE